MPRTREFTVSGMIPRKIKYRLPANSVSIKVNAQAEGYFRVRHRIGRSLVGIPVEGSAGAGAGRDCCTIHESPTKKAMSV